MNFFTMYWLLFKASVTSFSGLGSLPMVRQDFVLSRHVLTDHQLNTAVVAGRTGPGPFGLYLVCTGYLAGGMLGALAGFLALITPAFLAIPLMNWLGRKADNPQVRGAIRGVVLSAAGLLLSSTFPLTMDALTGPYSAVLIVASFALLTFTKIDSALLMAAAAIAGLASLLWRS
jgi:chromate transporter